MVEGSKANLRWAGNSLTTNGDDALRQVVVVSFVDGGAGMAAGTVSRGGTSDIAALVAASEQAARDAGPAEDADAVIDGRRAGAPAARRRLGRRPAPTSIEVFADFAPDLGQAFGEARDRGELLLRVRRARSFRPPTSAAPPACGCGTTSPPAGWSSTARAPTFARSVWSGTGTRDFRDVSVADLAAEVARKMAWSRAPRGAARRPVRDAAAAVGGRRPDDLPLLDDGGP